MIIANTKLITIAELANMWKNKVRIALFVVVITGFSFISGCRKNSESGTGFLEGNISIGPICPVETIPPDPGCLPTAETYKAYPVYVKTVDGSRKITLINPSLDGSFRTELGAGDYLISLEKEQKGIGSSNLPQQVSISKDETTLINIMIDTGIR